jgi:hypothetical protein
MQSHGTSQLHTAAVDIQKDSFRDGRRLRDKAFQGVSMYKGSTANTIALLGVSSRIRDTVVQVQTQHITHLSPTRQTSSRYGTESRELLARLETCTLGITRVYLTRCMEY